MDADDMKQAIPEQVAPPAGDGRFPVIGVGASAGGLRALQTFFTHMPADTGMAFVVIVHLVPEHESELAALLRRHTAMPVAQVRADVVVAPNQIYLIPPGQLLTIDDGLLRLEPFGDLGARRAPIDRFFRTLADTHDGRAGVVILSGMGADGALGLQRVKERGGVTLAQEPGEAEFDSMPRAAIASGLVDFVLPAAEMPGALIGYWRTARAIRLPPVDTPTATPDADALQAILAALRARTGHDFGDYKRATILRRIGRRMQVSGVATLPAYLEVLRARPDEVQALLRDFLISVTNFFRDQGAWQTLRDVVPHLFEAKAPSEPVRVWVAGCATGEEAYSAAMLLLDHASTLDRSPKIQVFATDIDEQAIARARRGVYPDTIAADVPPEYLRRFFVPEQGYYRVTPDLREAVLFAAHNLLHDPPFAWLDLVTCRNVLIYLDRAAQEQVLRQLHFSLRGDGYLLLGAGETTDALPQSFTLIEPSQRLYRRRGPPGAAQPPQPSAGRLAGRRPPLADEGETAGTPAWSELSAQLLARYGPPVAIVNREYGILHLSRGAGRFLRLDEGELSRNLLTLVPADIRIELRATLLAATQSGARAEVRRARMEVGGQLRQVNIVAQPIGEPAWARGALLVLFNDLSAADESDQPAASAAEPLVRQLEQDARRLREELRGSAEQYETAIEELQASNEELQASNEELRATGEELGTSKEELQSINEELLTVNQELKHKIEELSQRSDDLHNLIATTAIGTLFVDQQLRITRYTPAALEIFNLIASDVGRPLAHITHTLDDGELVSDVERVLQSATPIEREVRDAGDRWYLARFQPYMTHSNRVAGVVLSFVDITERKRQEANLAFLAEISADFAPRASADELMNRVGEKLARHLDLSRCNFSMVDAEADRITAIYDWRRSEAAPSVLGEHHISTFLSETGRQKYLAGELAVVEDSRNSPLMSAPPELLEQLDIGAVVDAPYLENGRWKFLLSACRPRPSAWRADEVELIRELTARIYIRLERARAEAALAESEARFRLLVDGARDYAMFLLDPDNRITFWSAGAERVFGWSEAEALGQSGAMIFTPEDRARGQVEREIRTALSEGRAEDRRWHITRAGTRLFLDGVLIRLDDASQMSRGFVKIGRDATAQRQAEDALLRAHDELEQRVAARTADLAAANAALELEIAERRQVERQRAALLERIITAQEDERQRVARELHDSLGQFLSALMLRLSSMQQLPGILPEIQDGMRGLRDLASQIDAEIDRLTVELRPPTLDDIGLADALASYTAEWSATSGVPVDLIPLNLGAGRLPAVAETTVYRVAQEALTNVLKHARASQVSIILERRAAALHVVVEDDGDGFDPSATADAGAGGRHMGLINMAERATLAGGTLTIESAPGAGTTIYLTIPLPEEAPEGDARPAG